MHELGVLLESIHEIESKYKELNKSEAYGFNIFSILLKSGDEVNLHTKFIYELLNPKGRHHQGRLFLDLFLDELAIEKSTESIEAFREKDNIDIVLQSLNTAIIIENKIHTQDHSLQLSRYWKSIKSQGYESSNIHLIYLTLFGEKPLEVSMQDKVMKISYRKEITTWLKKCIESVAAIPILKETLVQYLNLIQDLTEPSNKKGMTMALKELLLKEKNLQTIIQLSSAVNEAKIQIQFNFWQSLLSNLFPSYAFSFYNVNTDKGLEDSIRRYYELQKNDKDYGIEYQVEENLYFFVELRTNLYYGFYFEDTSVIQHGQQEALKNLEVEWFEKSNGIYWKYPSKRLDFQSFNHQNIFDLLDDEIGTIDIERISREIIMLIREYNIKKEQLC